ncbi:hypothetical protein JKF63_06009 [Porcisia hertigi]|uniref:Uncharacterized protein n=1 Tax=Porcisia hertigi TaxID=2761500 RepID=A0A836I8B2_9TRYP|nr:hypothetical protein JKF63_06009 [Porcisia hertigi]
MASILRRLRSWSPSPHRPAAKNVDATSDFFFVQVIAFGEVFPIPVCSTTPVTAVLRHVMEAAVTAEQAVALGNVEATLYNKEVPLQLDATMEAVPRNCVLHLHTSVSATSSAMRDRRYDTFSTLPDSRRRSSSTTITMQPCFRNKSLPGGVGEGFGFPVSLRPSSDSAGLSSEERPSPQRQEIPVITTLRGVSGSVLSAPHAVELMSVPTVRDTAPVLMWPPAVSSPSTVRTSGTGIVDEAPRYYFVPCGGAAMRTPMRFLSTQSHSVSEPLLVTGHSGNSVVEIATNCRIPPAGVNPLNTASLARPDPLLPSPVPSPPKAASAHADCFKNSNDKYLVVRLRLPYGSASARMSAAALNTDRNIVVGEMEASDVSVKALLDAGTSTVATTNAPVTRAYSYRSLRVLQDFPVGTLRELFAVGAEHRLHVAHTEVKDEQKTFREMCFAPNTIFHFEKRAERDSDIEAGPKDHHQRSLTPDSIREHLNDTVVMPQPMEMMKDVESDDRHRTLADVELLPSSADPFSHPTSPPVLSGSKPNFSADNVGQGIDTSGAVSRTVALPEGTNVSNDGDVCNPTSDAEQFVCVADGGVELPSATVTASRPALQAHEKTLSLAVSEEPRQVTELAALRDEAETVRQPQQPPQQKEQSNQEQRVINYDESRTEILRRGLVAPAEAGEQCCIDVNCCVSEDEEKDAAAVATAMPGAGAAAGAPQSVSASQAISTAAAAAQPAMDAAGSERRTGMSHRLSRRFSTLAEAKQKAGRGALHDRQDEAKNEAERARPSAKLSLMSWARKLVAKINGQCKPRASKALVPTALAPPRSTGKGPLPLSVTEPVQLAANAAASLNPLATVSSLMPSTSGESPRVMGRKSNNTSRKLKETLRAAEKPAMAAVMEKGRRAELGDMSEQPKVALRRGESFRGGVVCPSLRDRRVGASMPRQPIAFLDTDPSQASHTTLLAGTVDVTKDMSTTIEPALLSTTRVPTPHELPTPVPILISEKRGRHSGQEGNNHTPGSSSFENVSPASLRHCAAKRSLPEHSAKGTSNAHWLRITLVDPHDPTRSHYGVPVQLDCPVEALRGWITALQRPRTAADEDSPNLCDAERYGIFVGNRRLSVRESTTFAEVTSGRNDMVFSIRPL